LNDGVPCIFSVNFDLFSILSVGNTIVGSKLAHHQLLDKCEIDSPSLFGKVTGWLEMLNSNLVNFKTHRPSHQDYGLPATLLHSAFGKFVDCCKSSECCDCNDYQFTSKFCQKMCEVFRNELNRNYAVNNLLSSYLGKNVSEAHLLPGIHSATDGALFFVSEEQQQPKVPILIVEVKNEMGIGSSDPNMQGFGYYLQMLKSKFYSKWRDCTVMPVLLLSITGPFISFFFLANCDAAIMDPATFLCCLFLPHDIPQMTMLARAFRAMKECINALEISCRDALDVITNDASIEQLKFPYFKSFLMQGEKVELEYIEQLGLMRVFLAQIILSGKNTKVIVKFANSYCIEAHRICYDCMEGAPKLYFHGQLNGGWTVVVMEYLGDMKSSFALTSAQYSVLEKIITTLHSEGYVHGDFRRCNILVGSVDNQVIASSSSAAAAADRVCVIDFDWSGREGDVTYPGFMNHIDVNWPEGASDNKFIYKAHDLDFMMTYKPN